MRVLFYGRLEAEESSPKERLRIIVRHGWSLARFKTTGSGTILICCFYWVIHPYPCFLSQLRCVWTTKRRYVWIKSTLQDTDQTMNGLLNRTTEHRPRRQLEPHLQTVTKRSTNHHKRDTQWSRRCSMTTKRHKATSNYHRHKNANEEMTKQNDKQTDDRDIKQVQMNT